MAVFENRDVMLNAPCDKVFEFLGDFRNMEHLMPEQVQEFYAEADSCRFKVEGLSDFSMRFEEKKPCKYLHIVSDGNNPVDYSLDYHLFPMGSDRCSISITFRAALNPFMKMMASRSLQKVVDSMGSHLQDNFS